jgi:4-hydroxymandelate oxidase
MEAKKLPSRGVLILSTAAVMGGSLVWLLRRWRRRRSPGRRLLLNLKDYEAEALRTLPRASAEWLSEGAADGITLTSNEAAWHADGLELMPRGAVDVSTTDLQTILLTQSLPWPVICAPVSRQKLAHPAGELASARAAAASGSVYIAPHSMSCTTEQVAAAATEAAAAAGAGPARLWHQLYFLQGGSEATLAFVRRAEAAGYSEKKKEKR